MTAHPDHTSFFEDFSASLARPDIMAQLQAGLIGEGMSIPGPNGARPLIYADYVASGRALRQIEDTILTNVLPVYSNAHTEASYCGRAMNRMRAEARAIVGAACGADAQHAVIFTGSGATSGLGRLGALLGLDQWVQASLRPRVLVGPYEHHSNILPWRESGAEVIAVPEAANGGPDLAALEEMLVASRARPVIGAFSAASNVTGIVTDVAKVTSMLKAHGALSIWDYAAGAPYLPMDMGLGMDAIVFSPHKFIGGPGASGVLILRHDAVRRSTPTLPGGGTVNFVSPWGQDYSADAIAREEAGTPNVIGDIRAALCCLVKNVIGQDRLTARLEEMRVRALRVWATTPSLRLLGDPQARQALPVFSFLIMQPDGRQVHPQLVTRVLSDRFGIQGRGGCACAGPYAHQLLGLDRARSDELREAILKGREIEKPGWSRLAFSVLMSDAKVDSIINAVDQIARNSCEFTHAYRGDTYTARFHTEIA